MAGRRELEISLSILIAEAIGTVMLLSWIAAVTDVHLLPAALRISGDGVVLAIAGVLLTIPFIAAIVRLRREQP